MRKCTGNVYRHDEFKIRTKYNVNNILAYECFTPTKNK